MSTHSGGTADEATIPHRSQAASAEIGCNKRRLRSMRAACESYWSCLRLRSIKHSSQAHVLVQVIFGSVIVSRRVFLDCTITETRLTGRMLIEVDPVRFAVGV